MNTATTPTPPAKIATPATQPAKVRPQPAPIDPDAVTERHVYLEDEKPL